MVGDYRMIGMSGFIFFLLRALLCFVILVIILQQILPSSWSASLCLHWKQVLYIICRTMLDFGEEAGNPGVILGDPGSRQPGAIAAAVFGVILDDPGGGGRG